MAYVLSNQVCAQKCVPQIWIAILSAVKQVIANIELLVAVAHQ